MSRARSIIHFCAVAVAFSCSCSLRDRLQSELRVRFSASQRADLQAPWQDGHLPSLSWANLWTQDNWLYASYHDQALLGIGCLGEDVCSRLACDFQAPCCAPVELDFRPLWLQLDQLQSSRGASWAWPLAARLGQRLGQIFQRQPLLGWQEAERGFPRLGQLARLWGGLYHWEATCKN